MFLQKHAERSGLPGLQQHGRILGTDARSGHQVGLLRHTRYDGRLHRQERLIDGGPVSLHGIPRNKNRYFPGVDTRDRTPDLFRSGRI